MVASYFGLKSLLETNKKLTIFNKNSFFPNLQTNINQTKQAFE